MPVFSTSAQCWKTEAIALSPRLWLGLSTTLSTVAIALTEFALPGFAQSLIVPDDTLGAEGSVVFENFGGAPNEVIGGGAQRAQNLFHSFEEFNVDEGRGAFFESPEGIANIFSRVTGNNPSNILGTLGTLGGNADLFFMNPNGILFGPNATLDVQGSFAAITADAIEFGEAGFFSATNPEVPSELLTVDPSAFFFNQIPAGNITNQSVAPAGFSPLGIETLGLRVPDGQNLLFVGGDISMEGGRANALGGRIELGGLAEAGTIEIEANDGVYQLRFPTDRTLSNISLSNDARIATRGDGGGDLVVYAETLVATGGGRLVVGTEGPNDGGNLILSANNINFSGVGANGLRSGLYSQVLPTATGDGGDIIVSAESAIFSQGASVVNNVTGLGQGNAGNIRIDVSDRVTFDGTSDDGVFSSGAFSTVEAGGGGNGGNIDISTTTLEVLNGAQLSASTFGEGNAGSVIIEARDRVTFEGTSDNGVSSSGAFSTVNPGGIGTGATLISPLLP